MAGPFSPPASEDDNRSLQFAVLKCIRSGCRSDIADKAKNAGTNGNRRVAAQSHGNPSLIGPFSEVLSFGPDSGTRKVIKPAKAKTATRSRSEEHTSELQSL